MVEMNRDHFVVFKLAPRYYVTYQDVCSHSTDHGCTEAGEPYELLVKAPVTGDLTPYIAMGALTMVALVSAAAYMLLKRKAI